MSQVYAVTLTGLMLLALAAWAEEKPASNPPTPGAAAEPFHPRLLEIAKNYTTYRRVDERLLTTEILCVAPGPPVAYVSVSASKDNATHGRKLYNLFAKDRKAYLDVASRKQPVDQVLVKESWVCEEVKDDGKPLESMPRLKLDSIPGRPAPTISFVPYVRKDGHLYHAARQADLFILFKTDPATSGTDHGWVYGTVTADGKKVTSAGLVESCMKCHEKAPHDRLFGLAKE